MVDGFDFDLGMGLAGLDGFGFEGLGFGDLGGMGGFDLTPFAVDGMSFDGTGFDGMSFDGTDGLESIDLAGLDLDLGFDTLGAGSDLGDVLFAPDMGQLIDLDPTDPFAGGLPFDDPLAVDPGFASQLEPNVAMGGGPFGSPFLSPEVRGVAMTGTVAAGGIGTGAFVPNDLFNPPTDSFRVPIKTTATVSRKIRSWFAKTAKELPGDIAKDALTNQVVQGGKAVLARIRGADATR